MKTWYAYLYLYPEGMTIDRVDVSGIIFYVGKGTGGRFDAHEREAEKGCTCRKCCEIRRCWNAGFIIPKQIVFQTANEQEAYDKEQDLIRKHSGPYLTNIASNHRGDSKLIRRKRMYKLITQNGEALDITDLMKNKHIEELDLAKMSQIAKERASNHFEVE